jgi:hypothetical protein
LSSFFCVIKKDGKKIENEGDEKKKIKLGKREKIEMYRRQRKWSD